MALYSKIFESPVGLLKLTCDEYSLKEVRYIDEKENGSSIVPKVLQKTEIQLHEYFEGTRFQFDLDLKPEGTSFQQKVWQMIIKVDFGKTKSYGDIALELGSVSFSRAVGLANGQNPIPIIIPCHRIIGTNGKLTGYSGGLEKKKWLLIHEQKYSGNTLFL